MSVSRHSGRWSGYRHLLRWRILELKREPEVVFWVYIFPMLLAAALGGAFRSKPSDVTSVVVIAGDDAQKTLAILDESNKTLPAHSAIRATVSDRAAALKGFRLGK